MGKFKVLEVNKDILYGRFILNGSFGDYDKTGEPHISCRNKTGKPAIKIRMKLYYEGREDWFDIYIWSFGCELVIWPYVSSSVYMITLTDTEDQAIIFDAIREAGIDLTEELNYADKYCLDLDTNMSTKNKDLSAIDISREDSLSRKDFDRPYFDRDLAAELGLSIKEYRVLRADIRCLKIHRRTEKIKSMVADGYSYSKIAETMKLPSSFIKTLAESHEVTSEKSIERNRISEAYWSMIDEIIHEYDL